MTEVRNILIVDDELLIAIALADFLSLKGYNTIGPFARADEALLALRTSAPSAALLDVNLGDGEDSSEIARELSERSIPFAFLTGYADLPPEMRGFTDAALLVKPVDPRIALQKIEAMIDTSPASN